MRLTLFTLLIFSLLLTTTSAHPSGHHPRRRHANKQRRSRVQPSSSTIDTPTTANTTPQNGIKNENATEPTALGLWTPSSPSESGVGSSNANPNANAAEAAATAAPQPSASASGLGLFTPPSGDEGTPDSEVGSEGYGGWGGGGGGGRKSGWRGGSWGGGGWGGGQSQQQTQPSSAPVAGDMGVDISAGVDVSILKAGGGGGYGGYSAQSTAPASQPYAYQPPASQPYSEAPVPSISSSSYVAPPATTSYQRPTIYSTNYIEVTEWYTPPSTPATSSYQAPALSGQTDQGAIPTSQMYSPPSIAGTPTPTVPNSPSAANTGYSSSTAGGYSSNAVVTSGGQVVHTSSWKSSWTNSWSNAPSSTSQAPVATSAPQDDDQRKFVDCHNQWRNQYGAGNVSWGDELASYANTHASVCASMTHTNGPYGENLAAGTDGFMDIISSIGMWMDEASDYDASNPTYSHFTQVVWKETTTIGCAAINCGANTGMAGQIYIMCEYHPRGNVIGAFAQNVGKR